VAWPRNPFNELVYKAVMKGIDGKQLTPYQSDSLKNPYTREKVIDRISTEETVEKRPYPIERPNYTVDTTIRNTLAPSEIKKFRIMEEWIFDKETSQYTPRIIAVAPLFKPKRGGAELEEQTIFWVEWNELREILVNETMFNRKNDAARLTYYDFFEQRLYSSYTSLLRSSKLRKSSRNCLNLSTTCGSGKKPLLPHTLLSIEKPCSHEQGFF
jgi:hypothetical protein